MTVVIWCYIDKTKLNQVKTYFPVSEENVRDLSLKDGERCKKEGIRLFLKVKAA